MERYNRFPEGNKKSTEENQKKTETCMHNRSTIAVHKKMEVVDKPEHTATPTR